MTVYVIDGHGEDHRIIADRIFTRDNKAVSEHQAGRCSCLPSNCAGSCGEVIVMESSWGCAFKAKRALLSFSRRGEASALPK